MLTLDALRDFGASVDEGLARCMKNEKLYFRLVGMAVNDANFDKLADAVAADDLDAAFDAAHGLKGTLGNLALKPMYDVVSAMTEDLRARTHMDYGPSVAALLALRDQLKGLM